MAAPAEPTHPPTAAFQGLSCEQLVAWAEARLGAAALDERKRALLREHEIDGSALMLVSREDLARIGLPLGFAAKLKDAAEREIDSSTQKRPTPASAGDAAKRPRTGSPRVAQVARPQVDQPSGGVGAVVAGTQFSFPPRLTSG
jgi:hypothetical protein